MGSSKTPGTDALGMEVTAMPDSIRPSWDAVREKAATKVVDERNTAVTAACASVAAAADSR